MRSRSPCANTCSASTGGRRCRVRCLRLYWFDEPGGDLIAAAVGLYRVERQGLPSRCRANCRAAGGGTGAGGQAHAAESSQFFLQSRSGEPLELADPAHVSTMVAIIACTRWQTHRTGPRRAHRAIRTVPACGESRHQAVSTRGNSTLGINDGYAVDAGPVTSRHCAQQLVSGLDGC